MRGARQLRRGSGVMLAFGVLAGLVISIVAITREDRAGFPQTRPTGADRCDFGSGSNDIRDVVQGSSAIVEATFLELEVHRPPGASNELTQLRMRVDRVHGVKGAPTTDQTIDIWMASRPYPGSFIEGRRYVLGLFKAAHDGVVLDDPDRSPYGLSQGYRGRFEVRDGRVYRSCGGADGLREAVGDGQGQTLASFREQLRSARAQFGGQE